MAKLKRIGTPHVLAQLAKLTLHVNVPLKIDNGSVKLYVIISTELGEFCISFIKRPPRELTLLL